MMKLLPGLSLALLVSSALAPAYARHEGDPKILDRRPPYRGPGYRRDVALRGGPAEMAVDFSSSAVTLLAWLPLEELDGAAVSGNDCWGYVSGSGREYALVGVSSGLAVVEVTSPGDPQLIGFVAGPNILWRDVKIYQDHAYVVSEGGSGLQVVDLSQVDAGIVTHVADVTEPLGTSSATHNVVVDEVSGYLYRTGGDFHGLRIYSLADPAAPAYVGSWDDRYIHDAQAVTMTDGPLAGHELVFACSGFDFGFTSPGLDVLDVCDKQNVQVLANVPYPNGVYSHQAWLSPDRQYLYLNDELDENGVFPSTTIIFDVSDPEQPFVANTTDNGNTAITHNVFTLGDRLFAANYTDGLRVSDVSNPTDPVEVAFFDTFPDTDQTTYNGLWGNYPYLPSGIVLGSDLEKGLFVWWVGEPELAFSFPDGLPETVEPNGGVLAVDVAEAGGSLVGNSVTLHVDVGSGFTSIPMTPAGGDRYEANLPALPCGDALEFYVTAESGTGILWSEPGGAPVNAHQVTSSAGQLAVVTYDMEADDGWTVGDVGDDATDGFWERGDPAGGSAAQPEDAYSGSSLWATGLGAFEFYLDHDVDGGKTTLLSPVLDLSSYGDALISYWRWFSNEQDHFGGPQDADAFEVDVTDDGSNWVNVETVGPTGMEANPGWFRHQFQVSDFVGLTDSVQVRFVARDDSGGVVEAAVDDFSVVELVCDALSSDVDGVSLSAGGTQTLRLFAGAEQSGLNYWVLGAAGTNPGFPWQGFQIPLNVDFYFNFTIKHPNQPPFTNSLGVLDGGGAGQTLFSLPPATDPNLVGLELFHAYFTADGIGTLHFVSNPVPVLLEP